MTKNLRRLTILVPEPFMKWMDEIRDTTGASYGHQVREGLMLFHREVKKAGLIAVYPRLKGGRLSGGKDATT